MRNIIILFIGLFLIDWSICLSQRIQRITSNPGPGVFIDSTWGYSFYLPQGCVVKRELKVIDAPGYDGWICSGIEPDKIPYFKFTILNFNEYFRSLNPDERIRFTKDADTITEMVFVICHMQDHFVTAESNVAVLTDSILERRTDSGLRLFIQYSRESVDPRHEEGVESEEEGDSDEEVGSAVYTQKPEYYVAVPIKNNWIFIRFDGTSDSKILELQMKIIKSVSAWQK